MLLAYEPIWSQGVGNELDWDDKWAGARSEGPPGQARDRRHGGEGPRYVYELVQIKK